MVPGVVGDSAMKLHLGSLGNVLAGTLFLGLGAGVGAQQAPPASQHAR